MILKAIRFAEKKHRGQKRKVSGLDYFTHPLEVSYIVAAFKKSKNLEQILVAAILHDTLEDTKTSMAEIAEEFGNFVAVLVFELTSDDLMIKLHGKNEYLKKKMSGISNYALVIKLADRLHNLRDNPTDKMIEDTKELLTYVRAKRKLTATQKDLMEEIWTVINNR